LNIPHITDGNLFHVICLAERKHLTAGFMQNVSLLAVHLGTGSRLAFQQPAMTL
jgi:hypothetical protein